MLYNEVSLKMKRLRFGGGKSSLFFCFIASNIKIILRTEFSFPNIIWRKSLDKKRLEEKDIILTLFASTSLLLIWRCIQSCVPVCDCSWSGGVYSVVYLYEIVPDALVFTALFTCTWLFLLWLCLQPYLLVRNCSWYGGIYSLVDLYMIVPDTVVFTALLTCMWLFVMRYWLQLYLPVRDCSCCGGVNFLDHFLEL